MCDEEPSFAIGLPDLQAEAARTDWCLAFGFAAIFGILLAVLLPNFVKARDRGPRTACVSNCKNVATALEMYASDNQGHYPQTLQQLTRGNYLKIIPTCPAAGRVTFTNYHVSRYPDAYRFACVGVNHAESYKSYGNPGYNCPRYSSDTGLVEHP